MNAPNNARTHLRARYERNAPEGWRNYGDANPAGHGGLWVSYDADHGEWTVYETVHAYEIGLTDDPADEEADGVQYVTRADLQWRDVVTEDGEWSDTFDHIADVYHRGHPDPLGAIVDGDLTGYVAHEAREWLAPDPYRDQPVREPSYDDVLDRFGIEPAES